jgi:hypothetical protein
MQTATRVFAERGYGGKRALAVASFWRRNRTSKKDVMLESEFDLSLPVPCSCTIQCVHAKKTLKLHHAMQCKHPTQEINNACMAISAFGVYIYLPCRKKGREREKLQREHNYSANSFPNLLRASCRTQTIPFICSLLLPNLLLSQRPFFLVVDP